MSRNLTHALVETALEAGEAAANSAVTIAARLPILAHCLVRPSADGLAEWHGATSEKVVAAWEGAMEACMAWNAMMWRALAAPVTPAGMAHEALVLVRAASRPGHARVRANAARLGRY
ncbi:hypothetical protein [Enterovirga aerilata]|uniref:Uncharacterized protein n=1 Tax=Enterovirga aerilata TaxID=2730920 RepID=A0A849I7Q7_9HYPH|nr:hypothetical protein [Enterovirga sp. DB1703]NNM72325.1 hypothetical protein [Enterovirga sp. DB1703]